MTTIPHVARTMRTLLTVTAETIAWQTGCVQRRSKLTGAGLVQTLVLGWLAEPAATLQQLAQMAARLGITITPQALQQRFTATTAACLEQVLAATVTQVIQAAPVALPLLRRFPAVLVQDSTIVTLPAALASRWPASRATAPAPRAGLKLQVRWDLCTGRLQGPVPEPARTNDRRATRRLGPVPAGALYLADLGYFCLEELHTLAQHGGFFLSRLPVRTAVFLATGERVALGHWLRQQHQAWLECPIRIGHRHHLPVRLVVARVPAAVAATRRRRLKQDARRRGRTVNQARLQWADWTILITNAPPTRLSVQEVLVLARVRWQIELLFKLWKQDGLLATWRSTQPWRILSEVYAKLIAVVVQHWLLLVSCWQYPDRSLVQAAQTIRQEAVLLARAFTGVLTLPAALRQIAAGIAAGCRLNRRHHTPSTCQLLVALEAGGA